MKARETGRLDEEEFQDLPDDLEELDELLQDAKAKLDVQLDTDTGILADYERRVQEVNSRLNNNMCALMETWLLLLILSHYTSWIFFL